MLAHPSPILLNNANTLLRFKFAVDTLLFLSRAEIAIFSRYLIVKRGRGHVLVRHMICSVPPTKGPVNEYRSE